MKAIAPGKIIISGEHAVVYGKPALVLAINKNATTIIKKNPSTNITIELVNLDCKNSLSLNSALELKTHIKVKYEQFLQKKLNIRKVLLNQTQLFEYLFAAFIDHFSIIPNFGLTIQIKSNIPMGSGLGSSAATIISMLLGLTRYFKLFFDQAEIYELGFEAENLQHGFSSGVDPFIALHGGFVKFQQRKTKKLLFPDLDFFLVDTGKPSASTGECVEHVARKFKGSSIWDSFEDITTEIEKRVTEHLQPNIHELLKENHQLLTKIGVVPDKVQKFIAEIEDIGGAAKISGAGSVKGENAGALIVISDTNPEKIVKKYGYRLLPIKGEEQGARIV